MTDRDAANSCQGKGPGQERQLFERLQAEYEEATADFLSETEARAAR